MSSPTADFASTAHATSDSTSPSSPATTPMATYVRDMQTFIGYIREIFDHSIPDDQLKVLILLDTEWAPEFVASWRNGVRYTTRTDRLNEVGITVLCLAEVRRVINGRTSLSIQDVLSALRTVQLRVQENAKFQNSGETDRGDFLYMAPYLEFGRKHWIHKNRLQTEIKAAVFKLVRAAMPNTQVINPPIVSMAHAAKNDDTQLANVGIVLANIFNLVNAETLDSQQLARVKLNTNQPGLGALCTNLKIRLIGKHNGGNDAAYSMMYVLIIALWDADKHGLLTISDDPIAEVPQVVESLRNPHYDFTDTSLLDVPTQICCEYCGLDHPATACRKRCGYCLKKASGHTYENCPQRLQQSAAVPTHSRHPSASPDVQYYLLPQLLAAHGKGFLHENDITAREQNRNLSDITTVRVETKKVGQKERKRLEKERLEKERQAKMGGAK